MGGCDCFPKFTKWKNEKIKKLYKGVEVEYKEFYFEIDGLKVYNAAQLEINLANLETAYLVTTGAKYPLGLYDSASEFRTPVIAYKIVDASFLCPESKRCIIKFAKVERGKIAQICKWYNSDIDFGMTLHYHIEEMTPKILAQDVVFYDFITDMKGDPDKVAEFIYKNI